MGAPSVNLKLIIEKVRSSIDRAALAHGIQFYIPTLVTTLASVALFALLVGLGEADLNTAEALIMSSVILSLLSSASMQFAVYRTVDETEVSETPTLKNGFIGKVVLLASIFTAIISAAIAGLAHIFLSNAFSLSPMESLSFLILTVLYSVTWVLLAAVWATGHHRHPAIVFSLSYFAVFALGYSLSSLGAEFVVWGYVGGIGLLFISLAVAAVRLFAALRPGKPWGSVVSTFFHLVTRSAWGMLFQTLFVVALFLDKIIVWTAQGSAAGTGLQVIGTYTTGSFLGFLPTVSLVASAYFTERIKTASKGMYGGTFKDIKNRVSHYKRLYRSGITTMMIMGLVVLAGVILLSAYVIDDPEVVTVATTIGASILLFQIIVSNSAVLSVFNKNYLSALAMLAVCCGEGLSAFFVSYDVWYAALGFLAGSLLGLLISHISTVNVLSKFEYNAFHAFQTHT